ncbi:MAG: Cytochrome c-type biosis protein DsbD [Myxococcaceae bacterium]|nr:Cytochrome c-type biosis protein DsbD [Myxococcaceae bacterium]
MRKLLPSFSTLLTLAWAATARAESAAGVAGSTATSFKNALEGGDTFTPLLMSFGAGVATSLTPCVYPMIAITVSVFGARKVQSKLQGAALSTAFLLGMTTLFTALGVVAALSGGIFGDELGSPLVAGALALMFGAMALSMFGAFELALPYQWTTWLGDRGGIGYRGAFVLGMASSLIAAPCVGPVLGLLLPWIGTTGRVGFGALCMVAYSFGMGLLFWVVGTFAVGLPKSGRWMEWVKSAFGLIMIGSALYFLRAWLPGYGSIERAPLHLALGLGLLALGLVLGAVHLSFSSEGLGRQRKASGIVLASLGIVITVGYLEARPAHADWEHDLASARQSAATSGSPLLIDFGASWCQACGELERHTFSDPRVIAESRRFVKVKVDLSPGQNTKQGTAWLQGYGARGLPLVVLHDSQGKESARITEFVEADRMLQMLRAVN